MHKDVLRGVRWLLLKRPGDLDPSPREPERLREALQLNEPLAIASGCRWQADWRCVAALATRVFPDLQFGLSRGLAKLAIILARTRIFAGGTQERKEKYAHLD